MQALLAPKLPTAPRQTHRWGRLYGAADALAVASAARGHDGLTLVVTNDSQSAWRLESALRFFLGQTADHEPELPVLSFPDWETLPYDVFSPHQDIISQRLLTLHALPETKRGVLIVPAATLAHRVPPRSWLDGSVFLVKPGDTLDPDTTRKRLEAAGYLCVGQVFDHGEFAVRGSLLDLYPMGTAQPYRIDLFDDEVETIRTFDPETQRSADSVDEIRLLPGREFPMDEDAITRFRQGFRTSFEGNAQKSPIYTDVSQGLAPGGIEYYLPLFFEATDTLFDYLPADTLVLAQDQLIEGLESFWDEAHGRYEQRRHDIERPLLAPDALFLEPESVNTALDAWPRVALQRFELPDPAKADINHATAAPPELRLRGRAEDPASALKAHLASIKQQKGRVLFAAESAGRREVLTGMLRDHGISARGVDGWQGFLDSGEPVCITIAPMEEGLLLEDGPYSVIAETQIFGERAQQERRRKGAKRDPDTIIKDLTELREGSPVVHEEHGVGRYLGLQRLNVGGIDAEFLTLEYSGGDKLYVPVAALHVISRYSGAAEEKAPLHKLGGEQWSKIKKKAAEKLRDVAAELLHLYARREATPGHALKLEEGEYVAFAAGFPFEETPDQAAAIGQVLKDLTAERPMDRVVCGDVGFGKTEVAMRAAFAAVNDGGQVAVLVPTTLLASQHYQNFLDRFAEWPFKIEALSRFKSKKQQDAVLADLAEGKVDIVIGTHKLLQPSVKFKDLRLVIVDEEQRFGVKQKEQLKQLRAEVDLLTLTATPIPRTLNMAMSGMRDLSIIATPPAQRHAIKTFVSEWNDALLGEAILRELKRGGQVYFLHNEVESIEKMAKKVEELVPEARVDIGHGQMRESQLERVMLDFYHRRFNVLVSTTIIESGIDIPNANTIVINRADKLGLAQLHQIRGRVGRSHHRAYAYLVTPPKKTMTADAVKRLEAIESMDTLGAGFTLATHDLEIRGAGELLGEDQSGQMHEVGFSLYMDMLQRTVEAIKNGEEPDLDKPLHQGTEVDLRIPALLPDDYLPDVHTRLIMYKRIASASSTEELRELQVEMIDRFGLLPQATKNLFETTAIKLKATPMGITKIEGHGNGGRILLGPKPVINAEQLIRMIQKEAETFKLQGQEVLKYAYDMEEYPRRIEVVNEVLGRLAPPE
ncbi:MAG: transcription-repair coupling factor [Gammaproteobacteria bacterium]